MCICPWIYIKTTRGELRMLRGNMWPPCIFSQFISIWSNICMCGTSRKLMGRFLICYWMLCELWRRSGKRWKTFFFNHGWTLLSSYYLQHFHGFHNLWMGSLFHKDSSQNNIIWDCEISSGALKHDYGYQRGRGSRALRIVGEKVRRVKGTTPALSLLFHLSLSTISFWLAELIMGKWDSGDPPPSFRADQISSAQIQRPALQCWCHF